MDHKDLPPLDEKCGNCNGVGSIEEISYIWVGRGSARKQKENLRCPVTCEACNGIGRQPTEYGKTVLQFMRDFLRPEFMSDVHDRLNSAFHRI